MPVQSVSKVFVRFLLGIAALALAASTASSQSPPAPQQHKAAQWQNVDQLCGTLEFAMPEEKTITTAEGKTETRLYANVLKGEGSCSTEERLQRKTAAEEKR